MRMLPAILLLLFNEVMVFLVNLFFRERLGFGANTFLLKLPILLLIFAVFLGLLIMLLTLLTPLRRKKLSFTFDRESMVLFLKLLFIKEVSIFFYFSKALYFIALKLFTLILVDGDGDFLNFVLLRFFFPFVGLFPDETMLVSPRLL
jgi:hypothetical protein